jgi:class 3 adenylate cyclase
LDRNITRNSYGDTTGRKMEKLECTVCILDTRSFTDNLKYFSKQNDDSFIRLIHILCQNGLSLAFEIEKEARFYFNSTGDGFIIIFFGEHSSVKCYLYSLILKEINDMACRKFSMEKGREIKYGMGLESGTVEKIRMESRGYAVDTYIGDVINNASRIEAETKNHSRAEIIIGEHINRTIVRLLYEKDYDELVKKSKESSNREDITNRLNELTEINKNMLLSFLSEHKLKGLDTPISLFRVSPTLSKRENPYFNNFIETLTKYLHIDLGGLLKKAGVDPIPAVRPACGGGPGALSPPVAFF